MAESADPASESDGSLLEDDWVRDVTKMGLGWLIGTLIAIFLLIVVGPKVF